VPVDLRSARVARDLKRCVLHTPTVITPFTWIELPMASILTFWWTRMKWLGSLLAGGESWPGAMFRRAYAMRLPVAPEERLKGLPAEPAVTIL